MLIAFVNPKNMKANMKIITKEFTENVFCVLFSLIILSIIPQKHHRNNRKLQHHRHIARKYLDLMHHLIALHRLAHQY